MMNLLNRNSRWIMTGVCAVACLSYGMLGGCKGEEDAPVAVAPPPPLPPEPPPRPSVTPIADLMAQLNIDPRVKLAEEKAPDNDADRKAVLEFFDAFARGNSDAARRMLTLADSLELDALVKSGDWKSSTGQISEIIVETGSNMLNQKCALAKIELGSGADTYYQPQLWYYNTDGDPEFEAAPTPPGIMERLYGDDQIAMWHKILEEQIALAYQTDVDVEAPQRDLDDSDTQAGKEYEDNGGQGTGKGRLAPPPTTPSQPPGIPGGPGIGNR